MKSKNNKKAPILVTGIHRSGTIWLGKTLALSENSFFIFEPFNRHQIKWLLNRTYEYIYLTSKT